MKKTILLLVFLQVFFSCNGQSTKSLKNDYVQKMEFGLEGSVKEVTTYVCKVENGNIPTDKTKYYGKMIKQFDIQGNALKIQDQWDMGELGKSESLSIYSGKGRAISFKDIVHFKEEAATELNYKYDWSDNYHYTIAATDKSPYLTFITLDKDYRLSKIVFKNGNEIQVTQEFERIYKENKVWEIKETITDYNDGEKTITYQIQVVQKYDQYGNPTVVYSYNGLDKQQFENVLFTEYQYYEK